MVNDLAMDADKNKRHKFLVIDYRWTSVRLEIQPKYQRVLLKVLGLGRERKCGLRNNIEENLSSFLRLFCREKLNYSKVYKTRTSTYN